MWVIVILNKDVGILRMMDFEVYVSLFEIVFIVEGY